MCLMNHGAQLKARILMSAEVVSSPQMLRKELDRLFQIKTGFFSETFLQLE